MNEKSAKPVGSMRLIRLFITESSMHTYIPTVESDRELNTGAPTNGGRRQSGALKKQTSYTAKKK